MKKNTKCAIRNVISLLSIAVEISVFTACSEYYQFFNDYESKTSVILSAEKNKEAVAVETVAKQRSANSVYDEIENAINEMKPSVTVYTSNKAWEWVQFYSLPYASMNLRSYTYSILYSGKDDNRVITGYTYYFNYYDDISLSEYRQMQQEVDALAEEITSDITPDMSRIEKAQLINDWIVQNCVFDRSGTNPRCHSMYGVFHDHLAVCSGYAGAFKFLMNHAGEECSIVGSDSHAWNQVSKNPNIYVDCSWNDLDCIGDRGEEYLSYVYFSMSDEDLKLIDSHQVTKSSDDKVSSHPEYANTGYIPTNVFRSYDTSDIEDYCKAAYDAGYDYFTLKFVDKNTYEEAVEYLPKEIVGVFNNIGYDGALYYGKWDNLYIITVNLGEWGKAQ